MSIEALGAAFGHPDDWECVLQRLCGILVDVFEPKSPFEPPPSYFLDLNQVGTLDELIADVQRKVVRHAVNPRHPMAMAHMVPPPTTVSVIADLLIGSLNQCAFIWEEAPLAAALERRVIGWIADRVGFGSKRGGMLTSGGTLSNCLATYLALAHNQAINQGRCRGGKYKIIATDQAHFSIEKAAALTGIGRNAVIRVATDRCGRVRPGSIRQAAAQVLREGNIPMLVVCTAGTTNTGNIEPAEEFLVAARETAAWCHIDAAHGGSLCLSGSAQSEVDQWRLADSLSWDAHKSLYASYAVGILLTATQGALEPLRFSSDYAMSDGATDDAGSLHLEGSRRLEALKLWMCIKHLGLGWYQMVTQYTFSLASQFATRLAECDRFEMVGRPDTNIVCFRALHSRLDERETDELNRSVQQSLYRAGGPLLSTTRISGRVVLRAVLLNPRLRAEDLDCALARISSAVEIEFEAIMTRKAAEGHFHECSFGH